MLDTLISMGIKYYSGINTDFDHDVPQYGVRIGDMTHMLKTWITNEAPTSDKDGNKLVGVLQGSHFNTTDALQSSYVTKMHDLISIKQNQITSEFNKIKKIVTNSTNEMYNKLGRNDLEKMLIGNAEKYHEVFFEKDGSKLSTDFILKNPWDPNSTLNTIEREYLKRYVYFLYLFGKHSNSDLDTLDKFEKSEEFEQLMSSGKIKNILSVPLIKKQSLSRWKTITTDGFRKYIGSTWDSMKNALDVRDMTGDENEHEQKIGAFNSVNGFGKMYNRFDSQESKEFRDYLIDKHGIGTFEVNLDTIVLKYAFENLREKHFNEILPIIDSSLNVLKFYGWQTGKTEEVEKALDDFDKQVKISVFNVSPVKGSEMEHVLGIVKHAQKATSLMMLALRPVSLIKELVVGTIKNTSFAWSKIYGDDSFEGKHLTEAYHLMLKSQKDFNLIWELNDEYRIANRDMNQIVDKAKVDRHGLNFYSNMLYWSNTAPDYVNRLSLFLAKMVKDGCYEAHELDENGILKYNPEKDARYSHYLNKRKQYDYKMHSTDNLYNDQRSKYLATIQEFNETRVVTGEEPLTEKDLLPAAYTHGERESIKTFTELAYGYYDHERSPLIKHLPQGILFGQFMTFWPAKLKYYFGGVDQNSKRGHWGQKFKIVDGKKVNYFIKFETDELGDEYRYEIPENELKADDPRIKAYGWIGDPHEGLMYSLGLAIRAMLHPNESVSDLNPQTIRNAKLMTHDLIAMMISILLGMILFSEHTKLGGEGTTTNWKDMSQYEKLATRIAMRSLNEFDPISLLGQLQTTPVFIDKGSQVASDFKKLFDGKGKDGEVLSFFRNNISFLELMPNPNIK